MSNLDNPGIFYQVCS